MRSVLSRIGKSPRKFKNIPDLPFWNNKLISDGPKYFRSADVEMKDCPGPHFERYKMFQINPSVSKVGYFRLVK